MDDLQKRSELHGVEKCVINYFLNVCSKLNLSYTILGGTFLGAVRDKGFIPWDDDADFGMPRNDYEKLVTYLINNNDSEFPFLNFKNSDIKTYFSRIENHRIIVIDKSAEVDNSRFAWIDIFPLDGMPNDYLLRMMHKFNLLRLRLLLQYSQFSKIVNVNLTERPFLERVLIAFGKIIDPERILNKDKLTFKLDKALRKYSFNDSNFIVNFMGAYKFKEMFPKKIYEDLVEYSFDGLKLMGPRNSTEYLSSLYGKNFMMPPSEMIKNKHFTQIIINK